MNQLTSGFTGSFHLIVSILAMISGIMVLGMQKGTRRHRQLGYLYAVSMLLVNLTAFMIYRLFGGFGIFYFFCDSQFTNVRGRNVPNHTQKRKKRHL